MTPSLKGSSQISLLPNSSPEIDQRTPSAPRSMKIVNCSSGHHVFHSSSSQPRSQNFGIAHHEGFIDEVDQHHVQGATQRPTSICVSRAHCQFDQCVKESSVPAVVDVRGLTVSFGSVTAAVDGVDPSVSAGGIALVGRNGAGKPQPCACWLGYCPRDAQPRGDRGHDTVGQDPTAAKERTDTART